MSSALPFTSFFTGALGPKQSPASKIEEVSSGEQSATGGDRGALVVDVIFHPAAIARATNEAAAALASIANKAPFPPFLVELAMQHIEKDHAPLKLSRDYRRVSKRAYCGEVREGPTPSMQGPPQQLTERFAKELREREALHATRLRQARETMLQAKRQAGGVCGGGASTNSASAGPDALLPEIALPWQEAQSAKPPLPESNSGTEFVDALRALGGGGDGSRSSQNEACHSAASSPSVSEPARASPAVVLPWSSTATEPEERMSASAPAPARSAIATLRRPLIQEVELEVESPATEVSWRPDYSVRLEDGVVVVAIVLPQLVRFVDVFPSSFCSGKTGF